MRRETEQLGTNDRPFLSEHFEKSKVVKSFEYLLFHAVSTGRNGLDNGPNKCRDST